MIPRPAPRTEDGFTFALYESKTDTPKNLIVLFHGHGSNLSIWHKRAAQMQAERPDADVMVLQGPIRIKGKDAYTWLPYQTPVLKTAKTWLTHVFGRLQVAHDINTFLDKQLAKRNLQAEDCGLVGNSMGTIVALQARVSQQEALWRRDRLRRRGAALHQGRNETRDLPAHGRE